MLTQQGQERLFLGKQLFEPCEVALCKRLVFGIGELKKLPGGADIVYELLKHFGILHGDLERLDALLPLDAKVQRWLSNASSFDATRWLSTW